MEEKMIDPLWADWPAPENVKALTTTRQGGVSQGDFASLNLADHVEDGIEAVEKNRQILCQSLSIKEPVWLKQVHGVQVADTATAKHHTEADAIVSSQAESVCAVLTADCLPLLFCNKQGTHIAAAHAGWRGLANGVIESTVKAMQQNNKDLMVWLGPAIGPQCFEVGQDVVDAFVKSDKNSLKAFIKTDDKHYLADIYLLAKLRLNYLGIEQVFGGDQCSFSNEDYFYSFRRNQVTGRMASLIWFTGK